MMTNMCSVNENTGIEWKTCTLAFQIIFQNRLQGKYIMHCFLSSSNRSNRLNFAPMVMIGRQLVVTRKTE